MSKTPMMKQYDEAKSACGDALLLFRMGDFYELFFEDAKLAGEKLGLTVTSRDKSNNPIPMAGFPHHQLDTYLAKIVKLGLRAAVCEQVESPKVAKGLVKREITQMVTAGTITDEKLLDPSESNFLLAISSIDNTQATRSSRNQSTSQHNAALTESPTTLGLAWIELSTGFFCASQINSNELGDYLARLSPREILLPESKPECAQSPENCVLTSRPDWTFGPQRATETLNKHFGTNTLEGFGFLTRDLQAISAAGAVLEYVHESQRQTLDHIDKLIRYRSSQYVEIDEATWRSLEITRTIRAASREGSLFGVIDRCVTSMGSRCLGHWLGQPLRNINDIVARQGAVQGLFDQSGVRQNIRRMLREFCDIQRLVSRLATERITPRELRAIANSLGMLPDLIKVLKTVELPVFSKLARGIDPCESLQQELDRTLEFECPHLFREGGFIKAGVHTQLDEFRSLANGGKQWIAKYQASIAETTGISNLKVGYNKVFGYYLEVSNAQKGKVPDEFIRKQTLKNAERYITPDLKEYEEKVLNADEQSIDLELKIFEQLRQLTREHSRQLKANAEQIAKLDVFAGLAELAERQGYCRPVVTDQRGIQIEDGRHPVLDIIEPTGTFVPNGTDIQDEAGTFHLITGPNMAGKSTYIRQVALIVLMAQVGSFVPASKAQIGLVDRIFARVGASDELSRGQSTFMVEMTETARILNTASKNSLVILDEIGRGTSTFDGVSLAWAIVEYLHDQIGCLTLFATHYHELTVLEESLEGVANFSVAVEEWNDQIVFLHKIKPIAADKSYGIHVAKIAGVPTWVNQRAEQILDRFEASEDGQVVVDSTARSMDSQVQLTLFGPTHHPLIDKIKHIDTDHVTPISALQMIQSWQQELEVSVEDES